MLVAVVFLLVQSVVAIVIVAETIRLHRSLRRTGVSGQARELLFGGVAVLVALVARNFYVGLSDWSVGMSDWLSTVPVLLALAAIHACGNLQVQRAELEELIRNFSAIDALTGVFTRTAFLTVAGPLVLAAQRFKQSLSVLVIDIDHFYSMCEEFGSVASDEALRLFAGVLAASVRKVDILGRLGPEKFAVVLPHTDLKGAALVAEKICAAVREDIELTSAGQSIPLSASIGVVEMQDGNLENLLNLADGVKYSAGLPGRGRGRVIAL
jgi:diguanylate cyclase (GGDEF)-like protein